MNLLYDQLKGVSMTAVDEPHSEDDSDFECDDEYYQNREWEEMGDEVGSASGVELDPDLLLDRERVRLRAAQYELKQDVMRKSLMLTTTKTRSEMTATATM